MLVACFAVGHSPGDVKEDFLVFCGLSSEGAAGCFALNSQERITLVICFAERSKERLTLLYLLVFVERSREAHDVWAFVWILLVSALN
jgi:mannitol/fructose-specific phosphotransferase system IIA component